MATGLRVEDRLDGAVNFGAWKERMILLLQESELWDIVENSTTNPVMYLQMLLFWQPTPRRVSRLKESSLMPSRTI
jgi:hypothetical protein